MTSCCMWTLCSRLPTKPCCPSVHRGGKIQPDGIKLDLDMNKSTISVFTPRPGFTVRCLADWFDDWFIFRRHAGVIADEYHFKPGQTALVGENLSTHLSYFWHCCLPPACLTRTRCNERLMLSSEQKMKLQGNKHEWVSGKAIWLKESVEENRQSNKTPALLFSPHSSIKGTTSGHEQNFQSCF